MLPGPDDIQNKLLHVGEWTKGTVMRAGDISDWRLVQMFHWIIEKKITDRHMLSNLDTASYELLRRVSNGSEFAQLGYDGVERLFIFTKDKDSPPYMKIARKKLEKLMKEYKTATDGKG